MVLTKIKFLLAIILLVLVFSRLFSPAPTNQLLRPVGIVIPHHDLAREYIISSISKIAKKHQYSTIVVIGPNHFQLASSNFLSTPTFDNYPINSKIVTQLFESGYVNSDKTTCQNDHSLGNPLLYLHQYFPNANFVPILSPMNFNSDEIINLSKIFTSILPEDTLYVASVDFSHEKSLLEALEKNIQSEKAISSFDYQQIYRFQDDHLDSPATIGLLQNIMENIGATNWSTWDSSHGSMIEDQFDISATSYLIGVFSK